MARTFGPSIFQRDADGEFSASCQAGGMYCVFLSSSGAAHVCRHQGQPRPIADPKNTPEWCVMRADMLRDARDMAAGVEHYVERWSGRRSDEPRIIYSGIPSDAERQFRIASRTVKRGTLRLIDQRDNELARFPAASLPRKESE